MAGSRLERIGSIFSRATGLVRSQVVKYDDRPIWFDVYRVFPPTLDPVYDREPALPHGVPEEVLPIFYNEDTARSIFYTNYGNNPGGVVRNLTVHGTEDIAQPFITRYTEVEKEHPDWKPQEIGDFISPEFFFSRPQRTRPTPSSGTRLDKSPAASEAEDFEVTAAEEVRPKRMNVVTAETLLSMFQDAKKGGSKDSTE